MARRKTLSRIGAALAILLVPIVAVGTTVYMRPMWVFRQASTLQFQLSGAKSLYVNLNGHRIHYYVRGPISGPPVVLVHGLGGRAEDWVNLAPYLVNAGYRVYTPDLLGYGQSDKPQDANYSIQQESQLVTGFLDAMHLEQTDLAGWSMGGWIVQRVAADHPDRIRRLILIDSAGLRMAPEWDTRLFTPTTPAELDQLDALLMPNPPKIPGFLANDILTQSQQGAWVVHRALASMFTGQDVTDTQLPGLKMPVLILWGDQDQITPLTEGRAIHKLIPQSNLVIAHGCGHLAPEQCSAIYGRSLVEFLGADSFAQGTELEAENAGHL